MSCPLSAKRAIDSADTVRFVLEVLFIEQLFFGSSFPQGHQMIVFSAFILPDFKNHRIESPADPANGAILLRAILAAIQIIGIAE